MKKIVSLLFMSLIYPVFLNAQPQHFTFTANTGDSYSIVVDSVMLHGSSLHNGDEISVFTPNDLCVGASVWTGTPPLALTAWVDNSQTGGVDGYAAGDSMSFKIWASGTDSEYEATADYTKGNGNFGDGAYCIVSLSVMEQTENANIVTNTNDSGEGSLRRALEQANSNAGPDTIVFKIPQNDAHFDTSTGVWTIYPQSLLPAITDSNLVIDGKSQQAFIGQDTNPDGPEIEINGHELKMIGDNFLLKVSSSHNTISHLIINGMNGSGIWLPGEEANYNHIWGNYIGTNAAGTDTVPNSIGIYISQGSFNTIGGDNPEFRNLISGNLLNGFFIIGSAHGNRIIGNFIGTDATGTKDLGNGWMGIEMYSKVYENIIGGILPGERNIISGNGNGGILISGFRNEIIGNYIGTDVTGTKSIGNKWDGIELWGGAFNVIGGLEQGQGNLISGNFHIGLSIRQSSNNRIIGNNIGAQVGGTGNLGNASLGIYLTTGSQNNQIGPHNLITNSGLQGIYSYTDSTIQNTITQNSISNNSGSGIFYKQGKNIPLTPPSIFDFSSGTVSGTAPANSIVEIFSDPEDEGKIYEGNTTADNSGNFQWAGNPSGPYITATATDSAGNTSIFSQPYITTSVAKKVSLQIPDKFDLQQNYPNPFNPATTIHFELRSSGKPAVWVKLCIYNLQGELIRTLVNEKKAPGIYRVDWDGLDGRGRSVAAGTYLYRIIAGEFRAAKKMILLK